MPNSVRVTISVNSMTAFIRQFIRIVLAKNHSDLVRRPGRGGRNCDGRGLEPKPRPRVWTRRRGYPIAPAPLLSLLGIWAPIVLVTAGQSEPFVKRHRRVVVWVIQGLELEVDLRLLGGVWPRGSWGRRRWRHSKSLVIHVAWKNDGFFLISRVFQRLLLTSPLTFLKCYRASFLNIIW